VGSTPRMREIREGDRIEIVVGERDETKPAAPQFDDFVDDAVDTRLPRLLAVRAPDRAERAVLRTPADCLDRRPQIAAVRQQVPPCRYKVIRGEAAALVDRLWPSGQTVLNDTRPDQVAVAAHHGVARPVTDGFLRKQCRVNPAEHDPGATLPNLAPD